MRVKAPSGILSPALIVIGASLIRMLAELVRVQLPQLEDARADVRYRLETDEGLLGLWVVLERSLRTPEIHVRLVRLLDLPFPEAAGDGRYGALIIGGAEVNFAQLHIEVARGKGQI